MSAPLLFDLFGTLVTAGPDGGTVYPEATAAMLVRLSARHVLGVVSNADHTSEVRAHLARLGVADLMSVIVTSGETGCRKPDPAIFHEAAAMLDVRPGEVLFTGDSYRNDYEGARGAGMRALLIDPSGTAPVPPADRLRSVLDVEAVAGGAGPAPPASG